MGSNFQETLDSQLPNVDDLHKYKNEEGESLVHMACREENLQAVQKLISSGCSVTCVDNEGSSPLHICCYNLKQQGNDPNNKTKTQPNQTDGNTTNYQIAKVLIKAGGSVLVKIRDNHVRSALHLAAKGGDPKIIKLLIQYKASADWVDKEGKVAYDYVPRECIEARQVLREYTSFGPKKLKTSTSSKNPNTNTLKAQNSPELSTQKKSDSIKRGDSLQKTDSIKRGDSLQKTDSIKRTDSLQKNDSIKRTDSHLKTDSIKKTDSVRKSDSIKKIDSVPVKKTDSRRLSSNGLESSKHAYESMVDKVADQVFRSSQENHGKLQSVQGPNNRQINQVKDQVKINSQRVSRSHSPASSNNSAKQEQPKRTSENGDKSRNMSRTGSRPGSRAGSIKSQDKKGPQNEQVRRSSSRQSSGGQGTAPVRRSTDPVVQNKNMVSPRLRQTSEGPTNPTKSLTPTHSANYVKPRYKLVQSTDDPLNVDTSQHSVNNTNKSVNINNSNSNINNSNSNSNINNINNEQSTQSNVLHPPYNDGSGSYRQRQSINTKQQDQEQQKLIEQMQSLEIAVQANKDRHKSNDLDAPQKTDQSKNLKLETFGVGVGSPSTRESREHRKTKAQKLKTEIMMASTNTLDEIEMQQELQKQLQWKVQQERMQQVQQWEEQNKKRLEQDGINQKLEEEKQAQEILKNSQKQTSQGLQVETRNGSMDQDAQKNKKKSDISEQKQSKKPSTQEVQSQRVITNMDLKYLKTDIERSIEQKFESQKALNSIIEQELSKFESRLPDRQLMPILKEYQESNIKLMKDMEECKRKISDHDEQTVFQDKVIKDLRYQQMTMSDILRENHLEHLLHTNPNPAATQQSPTPDTQPKPDTPPRQGSLAHHKSDQIQIQLEALATQHGDDQWYSLQNEQGESKAADYNGGTAPQDKSLHGAQNYGAGRQARGVRYGEGIMQQNSTQQNLNQAYMYEGFNGLNGEPQQNTEQHDMLQFLKDKVEQLSVEIQDTKQSLGNQKIANGSPNENSPLFHEANQDLNDINSVENYRVENQKIVIGDAEQDEQFKSVSSFNDGLNIQSLKIYVKNLEQRLFRVEAQKIADQQESQRILESQQQQIQALQDSLIATQSKLSDGLSDNQMSIKVGDIQVLQSQFKCDIQNLQNSLQNMVSAQTAQDYGGIQSQIKAQQVQVAEMDKSLNKLQEDYKYHRNLFYPHSGEVQQLKLNLTERWQEHLQDIKNKHQSLDALKKQVLQVDEDKYQRQQFESNTKEKFQSIESITDELNYKIDNVLEQVEVLLNDPSIVSNPQFMQDTGKMIKDIKSTS